MLAMVRHATGTCCGRSKRGRAHGRGGEHVGKQARLASAVGRERRGVVQIKKLIFLYLFFPKFIQMKFWTFSKHFQNLDPKQKLLNILFSTTLQKEAKSNSQ
jgi:hypothetical protein